MTEVQNIFKTSWPIRKLAIYIGKGVTEWIKARCNCLLWGGQFGGCSIWEESMLAKKSVRWVEASWEWDELAVVPAALTLMAFP